ncbi:MAG: RNA methyltransferase [Burkholderiaceae bacterium]
MSLPQSYTTDYRLPLTKTFHYSAATLRFILVETSRPGNIGAAARAIKTMGFSNLVLVRPRLANAHRHPEAVAFASGALDVLQHAQEVATIHEALEGCNFAAAISARLREFSPPVTTPRELAVSLAEQSDRQVALVFGNERFGLPNEIVEKCNVLLNIPANPAYSSLNLAQAVQVVAYEMAMGLRTCADKVAIAHHGLTSARHGTTAVGFRGRTAALDEIEAMYTHFEQALIAIEFLDPAHPKKLMARLRRLFARTNLETEEVKILRGIARQILKTCRS